MIKALFKIKDKCCSGFFYFNYYLQHKVWFLRIEAARGQLRGSSSRPAGGERTRRAVRLCGHCAGTKRVQGLSLVFPLHHTALGSGCRSAWGDYPGSWRGGGGSLGDGSRLILLSSLVCTTVQGGFAQGSGKPPAREGTQRSFSRQQRAVRWGAGRRRCVVLVCTSKAVTRTAEQ